MMRGHVSATEQARGDSRENLPKDRLALTSAMSRVCAWGLVAGYQATCWIICFFSAIIVPTAYGQDAKNPSSKELQQLVEKIARGNADESREAADQLIKRVIDPVAEALGSVEARPAPEQVRVRQALARLSAALRVKLWRADLSPEDRQLLDRFAARRADLVEQLFDDNPERRLEALQQVPLEPSTAAGLLIVAKVNDSDGDVAEAALEIAASLADDVVVRGLTRFVQDSTAALKSGFYKAGEEDLALALSVFIVRSVKILGQAKAADAVPAITDALQYLGRSPYRRYLDIADVAAALGRIGDERAAPALLEFLGERRIHRNAMQREDAQGAPAAGQRTLITQTVGDAALLGLLQLYNFKPADFGFAKDTPDGDVFGFADAAARDTAHQAFRAWHAENGRKPAGERQPPATQPAEKK